MTELHKDILSILAVFAGAILLLLVIAIAYGCKGEAEKAAQKHAQRLDDKALAEDARSKSEALETRAGALEKTVKAAKPEDLPAMQGTLIAELAQIRQLASDLRITAEVLAKRVEDYKSEIQTMKKWGTFLIVGGLIGLAVGLIVFRSKAPIVAELSGALALTGVALQMIATWMPLMPWIVGGLAVVVAAYFAWSKWPNFNFSGATDARPSAGKKSR